MHKNALAAALLLMSSNCFAESIRLDCSKPGDKTILEVDLDKKIITMEANTAVCHSKFTFEDGYQRSPKRQERNCIDLMSEILPTMSQTVQIGEDIIRFGNNNHLFMIDRDTGAISGPGGFVGDCEPLSNERKF